MNFKVQLCLAVLFIAALSTASSHSHDKEGKDTSEKKTSQNYIRLSGCLPTEICGFTSLFQGKFIYQFYF